MDLRRISGLLSQADKLEVVTLDEVKRAAHISHNDDDTLIADDIEAAYDFLAGPGGEGWLNGCRLLEEEWEVYLPSSFGYRYALPLRPLSGTTLTGFGWVQADGSYLDVAADVFGFTASDGVGQILRSQLKPWPYLGAYHGRAYRVRFKAGFGDDRESIPSGLRKAIRMLACHWYDNPGLAGKVTDRIEFGLRSLAGQYRFHPDHS